MLFFFSHSYVILCFEYVRRSEFDFLLLVCKLFLQILLVCINIFMFMNDLVTVDMYIRWPHGRLLLS